jgi:hypothetical protein
MADSTPVPRQERKGRAFTAAAVCVLALVPLLFAPFPPSTDLPQHLAQVRLFDEARAAPAGPYVIQWLAPNNLIYLFLWGFWKILPAGLVARAALALILLLWVAAIHGLGALRGRDAAAAAAASLLLFNQSFGWGFLNFLIGLPAFALWFAQTAGEPRRLSWTRWAGLAGTGLLLYGSHALWFAAGGLWLVVIALVGKQPFKVLAGRLSALLPGGVISLFWYPRLSAARATAGFDVAPHWSPLFDRLASVKDSVIAGLRGPVGTLAFVFVLLWAGLAVWQHRRRLAGSVDRDFLAAAAFFLALAAAGPDKFMNTIFFASRWLPAALLFLLLALPAPSFRRVPSKAVALAAAAVLFAATAAAWHRYSLTDLSGFRESLDALPGSPRVLGLDLVKESDHVPGRPFLQLFAYAQVFRGGELNFSFAEHYSGLVAYRSKREVPWTPALEWYGEKVRRTDFAFFDVVLANGEEKDHAALGGFSELEPVTGAGKWRLYRVRK